MKPYPRANISEADGVTLSPDLYNRIVEDIERLDRLSVMPPLFMTGGASGTTIGFRDAGCGLAAEHADISISGWDAAFAAG